MKIMKKIISIILCLFVIFPFTYFTACKTSDEGVPKFATGSAISLLSNDYQEVEITYPQATCEDNIENYRVEIYIGNTLIKSEYGLSENNSDGSAETITTKITGLLPSIEYTIKVVPVSCFGKEGTPLTTTITTSVKDADEEFILLDADTADAATALRQCKGALWNSKKATRVENADLPVYGYSGAAIKMSLGSNYDIYATLNYGKTEIQALANAYGYEQVVITYLLVKEEATQSTFNDNAGVLSSCEYNEWVSEIVNIDKLLGCLGKNVKATNAPADNVLLVGVWWRQYGELTMYLGDISFVEPTVE